jgi:hypothetical protein
MNEVRILEEVLNIPSGAPRTSAAGIKECDGTQVTSGICGATERGGADPHESKNGDMQVE